MATSAIGYGPRGRWELRFLAHMKIRKLKATILRDEGDPLADVAADAEKNETAFAELIQYLDERSLGLVMHDGRDDGRKSLKILREHYAGSGKPRIIVLYTTLTSLQKNVSESVTDYIIRAETAASSLKAAGEVISDGLLISMVLKGLPPEYKSFVVIITQSDKVLTFQSSRFV